MKKMSIYCLFVGLLATVICPAHLGAQEMIVRSRAAIDSLVNPPLLKDGELILSFDSCKKYIGTLSEDDAPRTYSFPFRNASTSAVSVARVSTSCGCTVATFEKQPIAPGAKSVITLTYNPENRPGTVDAQAFVYTTASDKHPVARLTLLGNVESSDEWDYLPHSAGALRMKRQQVVFTEVTSSTRPSERILCANSGQTPLKLSAVMLPPYARFHTEPAIIEPGKEGDIVIKVDGSKIPANAGKEVRFTILIEGVSGRPTDRMVKATIKRIR